MSIIVRNLQKRFGDFVALDNVSLDFPAGELVALLGPSGCGKTTLLRVIAGLEYADAGSVVLNGEDVAAVGARERQVGFVFQHYALFRHMTVFENVAFGLRVKPRKDNPFLRNTRVIEPDQVFTIEPSMSIKVATGAWPDVKKFRPSCARARSLMRIPPPAVAGR